MSDSAVIKRLTMLLKEEGLVKEYIDQYGEEINIAHIKAIKEKQEQLSLVAELEGLNVQPLDDTVEPIGIGEDPVYENTLICPVCKYNSVTSYNLRAKSQFVEESHFLVPLYSGIGKFRKENFTKLQTTVCPACLFASPDPKDFSKYIAYTDKTVNSQLLVHRKLLFHLDDTTADRFAFMAQNGVPKPDFSRPRSLQIAILTIRLSIQRAELEREHDLPNTFFKIGSYHLRIAQLLKENGKDNLEELQTAVSYFEKAVLESDCNVFEIEMEALYLCIAINIKLGNKEKVAAFFKLIKDVEMEVTEELKENAALLKYKKKFSTMEKWEKRAKTAIEYRDDKSYWETV